MQPSLRASNVNASYRPLASGDAGIAQTIAAMQKLVEGPEGARNPAVRAAAISITRNVNNGDKRGEIAAIHSWVQQNIKFQGEYGETLQTPVVTLNFSSGDCDDHSVLTAALLQALGFETRFRTVAADRSAPGDFSHVYTEVQDPVAAKQGEDRWIALETTVSDVPLGWYPRDVTRSKAWAMSGIHSAGLGRLPSSTQRSARTPRMRGLGDPITPIPGASPAESALLDITNTFADNLAPALAARVAGDNASLIQFRIPGGSGSATANYGPLLIFGIVGLGIFLLVRR